MLTVDRSLPRHYGDQAGRYWSVSQVCRAVIGQTYEPSSEGAERGTDVHTMFALILGARMGWCEAPEVPPEYAGYADGIHRWMTEHDAAPSMLETPLKHRTLPYAGTPDYVGKVGRHWGVVDLKTGQPERWHVMQVRAYKEMLDPGCWMWVLYLSDDGTYRFVRCTDTGRAWAAFQAGISILQWREG